MGHETLNAVTNHPWLIPMVKWNLFYERCSKHGPKRCIFFCCDCMTPPLCKECKLNEHNAHNVIQTYRNLYQSGLRVETISEFIDTSDIFQYTKHSNEIVFINQKCEKEHSYIKNVTGRCELRGCDAKFCSIECKLKNNFGSKLDELMEKQETKSQAGVCKPKRKHKRKGSPHRAPFS